MDPDGTAAGRGLSDRDSPPRRLGYGLEVVNGDCMVCCSYYDTDIVLITMGITAGVCLAISIFAIQTKV